MYKLLHLYINSMAEKHFLFEIRYIKEQIP